MRMWVATGALSLVIAYATSVQAAECRGDSLLGTWKQVKVKIGDQEIKPTATSQEIKLMTPTHFTWVNFDPTTGKVIATGGGTYTLAGSSYIENVVFAYGGPDVESLSKKEFKFTCSIDKNTWNISGTVLGSALEETLERVAAQ